MLREVVPDIDTELVMCLDEESIPNGDICLIIEWPDDPVETLTTFFADSEGFVTVTGAYQAAMRKETGNGPGEV